MGAGIVEEGMWRRWMMVACVAIAGGILVLLARLGGAHRDPVVQGLPMSAWAFGVVERGYGRDSYYVPATNMIAFRADRDAAIFWLGRVVNYETPRTHIWWRQITLKLPGPLGERLRPRPRRIANRWAAVLALSLLAKDQADARIRDVILSCARHSNIAVRKVAAYEARPWLWPADHTIAASILRTALEDVNKEVRRDACRRITESAANAPEDYTMALQSFAPKLCELAGKDRDIADHAAKALAALEGKNVRVRE